MGVHFEIGLTTEGKMAEMRGTTGWTDREGRTRRSTRETSRRVIPFLEKMTEEV